ncbi:unnamed protein product [Caenorhabditis brenneri]
MYFFQREYKDEHMQDSMPASAMLTPTDSTLLDETCSRSLENPTNSVPSRVETGEMKDFTKAAPQKYEVGFGPKKISLLAPMKMSEERTTQKRSELYWSVGEDFRDPMTSRKVKKRKNRNDLYTVTESIPSGSIS